MRYVFRSERLSDSRFHLPHPSTEQLRRLLDSTTKLETFHRPPYLEFPRRKDVRQTLTSRIADCRYSTMLSARCVSFRFSNRESRRRSFPSLPPIRIYERCRQSSFHHPKPLRHPVAPIPTEALDSFSFLLLR